MEGERRVWREGGEYGGRREWREREEDMEGGMRVWREEGGWGKGKERDRREILSLLSFPGLSQFFDHLQYTKLKVKKSWIQS